MKRSINLLLIDGDAAGCWKGEFSNRTLVAYKMSRHQLVEGSYKVRPEFDYSGVYVLFGLDDDGLPLAYIGEAENCLKRIRQHLGDAHAGFWTEFILYIKSDNKLNKAHIRWLENALIKDAAASGRYRLENAMGSPSASLSESDEADVEELLGDIELMTGVLGHKIFEPLVHEYARDPGADSLSEETLFFLAKARAVQTADGFVVRQGSKISPDTAKVLNDGYRKQRERLMASGAVNGDFITTRDCLFTSSSSAATFVTGKKLGGPHAWRDASGVTLAEHERAASNVQ